MRTSGHKLVMISFQFNVIVLRYFILGHGTNVLRPTLGGTVCCFPVKLLVGGCIPWWRVKLRVEQACETQPSTRFALNLIK